MSSGARIVSSRYADVALATLLLGIVALMIVPVPTALLDLLLAANISLAALMLLVAMTIPNGLAFAAMPTILLVTTLYRLALNVSSTRLILLQADAGRVIASFGDFVVRGNYAVGAVVFLILTLIQYIVVARGAERVAEVGARFALDAMPGKQLAIDSDVRSGAISPDAARELRRTLERESQFYGAMDGAMKFVKGDAIAGIVITAINIIAGVGIGVGMRKLGVAHSLQLYGLLTIGDGLVCQIPSLLISTAAGLVVTRVASAQHGDSLGGDVGRQLFGEPRVLALAAGFLTLLALVPGLPALPFGFCALLLGSASYGLRRMRANSGAPQLADSELASGGEAALRLELGSELARAVSTGSELERAVREQRERVLADLGLRFGALPLQVSPALHAYGYVLALHDVPIARGQLDASGEPAQLAGQLAQLIGARVRRHAAELFGLEQTQRWLDELERSAPALVRTLVPKPVALPLLCDVLRRLVAEGISIRPRERILEALAACTPTENGESAALTERVRTRLSRQITHAATHDGVLALHALDPMIEDALRDALAAGNGALALPPDQARDIVAAVRALQTSSEPRAPVLISQPDVRRHLRALLEPELPDVRVLSYPELAPDVQVEQRARVRLTITS